MSQRADEEKAPDSCEPGAQVPPKRPRETHEDDADWARRRLARLLRKLRALTRLGVAL
jgi:hypothetical protein